MSTTTAVKPANKTERKDSVTSNNVAKVNPEAIQDLVGPLTEAEQQHLAKCEAVIEKGIKSFLEVTEALLEVCQHKLYRVTHKTFQDYCANRWNITARHANRLMLAGEVVKNIKSDQLVSSVPSAVPENEAQARPLASLTAPEQVKAARIAKKKSDKPTAKDFQAAAVEAKGKKPEAQPAKDDGEKPSVQSYDPRKNSGKDDLEKLLVLLDEAETQARKIIDCGDVVKTLSELGKVITRKLNGGAK